MDLKRKILMLLIITAFLNQVTAQDMGGATLLSQKATISQRIGVTDVSVIYHSPSVKGRKIFGGIVPFDFKVDGKEYPWRSGSNKNTIIEFSTDVAINGKALKAGKYGLHIYVEKKQWTFIFSNNADSWGSFQYDAKDDELRVTVPTEKASFQEWLSYDFTYRRNESARMELHWDKTKASFTVTSDVTKLRMAELEAKADKSGADYYDLVEEKMKSPDYSVKDALSLIDKSIALLEAEEPAPNNRALIFGSKALKADILIEKGDRAAGEKLQKEVLATAQGFDIYYYGLKPLLLKGDKETTFKRLSDYVKRKPIDWIAHLSLGEYYLNQKQPKKVVEHFQQAYENATENWKNYARYLYLQNKVLLDR